MKSECVVLLATLVVSVPDSTGQQQLCRVFLDPGSESNFVSEDCVQRLGLKRKKTCVTVSGIGGVAGEPAKGQVNLTLLSLKGQFTINLNALVYRRLTGNLMPRQKCKSDWPHLAGLDLSDPGYFKPSAIDILLGATAAGQIMLPGIVRGPPNSPVAQLTKFGWMLSGAVEMHSPFDPTHSMSSSAQVSSSHVMCRVDEECLQDSIERFWKLEELEPAQCNLSSEDQRCEDHFASTHQRSPDGTYTVELPFKNSDLVLGNSRDAAVKRFLRVENRLVANPSVQAQYVKAMQDSIALNFLELVPANELSKPASASYYLPHREVVKESSSSTKVRIVYDASAKSASGNSLNDLQIGRASCRERV